QPDGSEFAHEAPSGTGGYPESRVRSMPTNAVRTVSTAGTSPAWSPDGRWIAYTLAGSLYYVASAGGAPVLLGGSPLLPRPNTIGVPFWSPDGSAIAFATATAVRFYPGKGWVD